MQWLYISILCLLCHAAQSHEDVEFDCPAPAPCSCTTGVIWCSHHKLSLIPSFHKTFKNFSNILLQYNDITTIEEAAFINMTTNGSLSIDINDNPINHFDDEAFAGLEGTQVELSMRRLNLSALPVALKALNRLKVLDIDRLKSLNPGVMRVIGHSLKRFRLEMDGMSQWPNELRYLIHLTDLELVRLRDRVVVPEDAFAGLEHSLSKLQITRSSLNPFPTAICNLRTLTELELIGCTLAPSANIFPMCHEPLTCVNYLIFRDAGLPYFPDIFKTFPNITFLQFDTVWEIGNLDSVNLKSNMMNRFEWTGARLTHIPPFLSQMTNLQHVRIGGIITTLGENDFKGMTNLRVLDLGNNPIKYISYRAFDNTPSLEELNLLGSHLQTIPRAILRIPSLMILNLNNNFLDCSCLFSWLLHWEKLHSIDIRGRCHGGHLGPSLTIMKYIQTDLNSCPVSPIG